MVILHTLCCFFIVPGMHLQHAAYEFSHSDDLLMFASLHSASLFSFSRLLLFDLLLLLLLLRFSNKTLFLFARLKTIRNTVGCWVMRCSFTRSHSSSEIMSRDVLGQTERGFNKPTSHAGQKHTNWWVCSMVLAEDGTPEAIV